MPANLINTLFLLIILSICSKTAAGTELPPLILAVHPYLPVAEIQSRFSPLAKYLGKVLQRNVVVRVGSDYDEHVEAIGNNNVDIAFMGPSSYVLMRARHGMKPLLARIEVEGKPVLSGVIITSKTSSLGKLSDLHGRRFAFGDKESTMSTLVPRFMLQEAGVSLHDLSGYEFLGGHKNVALGVLSGDYDAGAVKQEVYDELAPRGLRILAKMPSVSEHLFVTRSDFPAADVEKLRKSLLSLRTQPEGVSIMHAINKKMTNLVPVSDQDYESLRIMMRSGGVLTR